MSQCCSAVRMAGHSRQPHASCWLPVQVLGNTAPLTPAQIAAGTAGSTPVLAQGLLSLLQDAVDPQLPAASTGSSVYSATITGLPEPSNVTVCHLGCTTGCKHACQWLKKVIRPCCALAGRLACSRKPCWSCACVRLCSGQQGQPTVCMFLCVQVASTTNHIHSCHARLQLLLHAWSQCSHHVVVHSAQGPACAAGAFGSPGHSRQPFASHQHAVQHHDPGRVTSSLRCSESERGCCQRSGRHLPAAACSPAVPAGQCLICCVPVSQRLGTKCFLGPAGASSMAGPWASAPCNAP